MALETLLVEARQPRSGEPLRATGGTTVSVLFAAGVSQRTIYERWQARAAEHGLTHEVVAGVLDRDPAQMTVRERSGGLATTPAMNPTQFQLVALPERCMNSWVTKNAEGSCRVGMLARRVVLLPDLWLGPPTSDLDHGRDG